MARAVWNGMVVAESDAVVVVDGYTYFPRDAVRWEYLEPSEHTSRCSWKGDAGITRLQVDGSTNPNAGGVADLARLPVRRERLAR